MPIAPFPINAYCGVYPVGSHTGGTKECFVTFDLPAGAAGSPMILLQPLFNGASSETFATRLKSWSTTSTQMTVNFLISEVRPPGVNPTAGWTFDLQVGIVLLYPTIEMLPIAPGEEEDGSGV